MRSELVLLAVVTLIATLMLAIVGLLATTSHAKAAHCPLGQIFRVHLGQCFDAGAPEARAYRAFAPHAIRARGKQHVSIDIPPLPPPPSPAFPLPTLIGIQWNGDADDETRARLLLRAALAKEE